MQEDKISISSLFVTLTYDTRTVPITKKGYMSLKKRDFQLFMKRLRFNTGQKNLRYYACGEYGTKTFRPHYHMIIFNLEDQEEILKAWNKGSVHIGDVSGASIAYTCKYIDKEKRIPLHRNDDRVREFSLMSKKLGSSYLTEKMISYHKSDVNGRMFVTALGGQKLPMPRYYREKIYTEDEKKQQRKHVVNIIAQKRTEVEKYLQEKKLEFTIDEYIALQRVARDKNFYKNQNLRK